VFSGCFALNLGHIRRFFVASGHFTLILEVLSPKISS